MPELRCIFSDDRGEKLEHYGVPGMKWGVRNAETERKYAGPKGYRTKIGAKAAVHTLNRYSKKMSVARHDLKGFKRALRGSRRTAFNQRKQLRYDIAECLNDLDAYGAKSDVVKARLAASGYELTSKVVKFKADSVFDEKGNFAPGPEPYDSYARVKLHSTRYKIR